MSNPDEPLNYQTPNRNSGDGIRAAAWICALVLGIILALAGTALGLFLLYLVSEEGLPDNGIILFLVLLFAAASIGAVVSGILDMVYCNGIRRSSRRAAVIVQRVAVACTIGLVLLMFILVVLASPAGVGVCFICGFFILFIAPNIALSAICRRALRHPAALTE